VLLININYLLLLSQIAKCFFVERLGRIKPTVKSCRPKGRFSKARQVVTVDSLTGFDILIGPHYVVTNCIRICGAIVWTVHKALDLHVWFVTVLNCRADFILYEPYWRRIDANRVAVSIAG